jgi:hypothetical protein
MREPLLMDVVHPLFQGGLSGPRRLNLGFVDLY